MPIIPAIPAKAGGAGIGSLKNAKISPTINPVNVAINTVFILSPLSKSMTKWIMHYEKGRAVCFNRWKENRKY